MHSLQRNWCPDLVCLARIRTISKDEDVFRAADSPFDRRIQRGAVAARTRTHEVSNHDARRIENRLAVTQSRVPRALFACKTVADGGILTSGSPLMGTASGLLALWRLSPPVPNSCMAQYHRPLVASPHATH